MKRNGLLGWVSIFQKFRSKQAFIGGVRRWHSDLHYIAVSFQTDITRINQEMAGLFKRNIFISALLFSSSLSYFPPIHDHFQTPPNASVIKCYVHTRQNSKTHQLAIYARDL